MTRTDIPLILYEGANYEVCKEHGSAYRRAIGRTVSGTYCALRVAASTNHRPSGFPCKCGAEFVSNQAGRFSFVCELRANDWHRDRGMAGFSSVQRGHGPLARGRERDHVYGTSSPLALWLITKGFEERVTR